MKKKIRVLFSIIGLVVFLYTTGVFADAYELYSTELVEPQIGDNSVSILASINVNNAVEVSDPGTVTNTYSANGTKLYRFVPQSTGYYSIKSVSLNNQTWLELYDESGTYIMTCTWGRAGDNMTDFHMGEVLTGGEVYYARVKSSNYKTFPVYFYADDYTDGTNVANPLPIGVDVNGEINYTADRDVFTFTPIISGEYTITVSGNSGTAVKIYTDINHSLAEVTDSERDGDVYTVTADFQSGSVYYIDVYGESTSVTGGYVLNASLLDDDANADMKHNGFYANSNKEASLQAGEALIYQLYPYASGNHSFTTDYDSDLTIYVCDSYGNIAGTLEQEYSGGQLYSLSAYLDATKTYYLIIRNYVTSSKELTIDFYYDDVGDCYNSSIQLSDQSITAIIDYPGDRDVFAANKGKIRLMSDTAVTVQVINAASYGQVTSASGREISINNTNYDNVFIIVKNKNVDGIGDYCIRLESPMLSYTTIQQGHSYSVSVSSAGETDLFMYNPVQSGYYLFDAGDTTGNYTMEVLDYCYNSIQSGTLNCKVWLQKGKTYFFKAGKTNNSTGNYSFSFVKDDYESEAGRNGNYSYTLSSDEYIEGTIDFNGDSDYFDIYALGNYKIKNILPTNMSFTLVSSDSNIIASGAELMENFSQYSDNYPALSISGTGGTTGKYKIIMEATDSSVSVPAKQDEIVNIEIRDVLQQNQAVRYTVSFSSSDFEVYDANGMTFELDTIAGNSGAGIVIDSVTPTSVTFTVTGKGSLFKDVLNVVRLKAKRTGTCRYYLEKTV